MSIWTIFTKALRDARGMTLGMGLALALIAMIVVLLFPSYRDSMKGFELPEYMKAFLGEASGIGTPEGFMTTEYFSWAPLLGIVVAIMTGSYAFVGEEADGTLDLLLSHPIRRWHLAVAKIVALTVAMVGLLFAGVPGFAIGQAFSDMDLPLGRFLAATANMVPLVALFLGLTLIGSALLPSRGGALLAPIATVVVTYFIQMVATVVPAVEGLRVVSPFYWAEPSRVLIHGFDWTRSSIMMAIALVEFALAVWALEHREIAQGSREIRIGGAVRRRLGRTAPPAAETS